MRVAVARLPLDWVLEHIEAVAEPLLAEGDYDNYGRMIELYGVVDRELALKLARRAMAHDDPDIRETGAHALNWL